MLISIVVITYNFENIIEECLNSILSQNDTNIELIISDDCSKDKTIEVCKKWEEKNKDKFKIKILESQQNEGVVKNINKGAKETSGEWVKFLAGDDLLAENSLKNFREFIKKNQEAEVIFSKVHSFFIESNQKRFKEILPHDLEFYKLDNKKQLNIILEENHICAPSVIMKKNLLESMNYFDERFKMIEDYPFWIKLLKNNIKFYFLSEITVFYRISSNSVSGRDKSKRINLTMFEFEKQFYKEIYRKEVKNPLKKWDKWIELKRKEFIIRCGNKSNIFTQLMRFLQYKNINKYKKKIILIIVLLCIIKIII